MAWSMKGFWRRAARSLAVAVLLAGIGAVAAAPPTTFEQAKTELRTEVYFDQNRNGALGTVYCGCDWEWLGRSGGRIDFDSCGYEIRAQEHRGIRTEWEHVVPMSNIGRARQCWQDGGRRKCQRTDPAYNVIEADMHNLTPSVGEINADRSNYRFGVLPDEPLKHESCDFRVHFAGRVAEPRDEVKGLLARIYFYVHDRYDLPMSDGQERLLMAWDQQFPVTDWERERDRRIAAVMGHSNPFVTGDRQWTRGHNNSAEGMLTAIPADHPALGSATEKRASAPIRGNRNSKIYHMPRGCPSYSRISEQNIVEFATAAEAEDAGYRKARNCR